MKDTYSTPIVEVKGFTALDVITTSNPSGGGGGIEGGVGEDD